MLLKKINVKTNCVMKYRTFSIAFYLTTVTRLKVLFTHYTYINTHLNKYVKCDFTKMYSFKNIH